MRTQMIKGQLQPQKIVNPAILGAFQKVPREFFLDSHYQNLGYLDKDIPITKEPSPRVLLSARKIAKLFNLIDFRNTPKILIIGFGTGYSLALAYELGAKVYGIEGNNLLYSFAQMAFQRYFDHFYGQTNFDDFLFIENDILTKGLPDHELFDYILVEGGIGYVPENLLTQLRPQGKLVSIYLKEPLGIFSCTKEGHMHHDSFERTMPLTGFTEEKIFSL
ncbi:MAG: hypothetical protein K2X98_04190 [Alphaproteobacteria bacterium]|nr:hypothetical protein [Alphaproteobacteria bacterium]